MDLDQLKALTLLWRKGTLRHAGNALGLTPSGVSLRLKRLEEELRLTLFERRPNKLLLTESGKQFCEHVAGALDELDNAVFLARGNEKQAQTITVALGSDTTFLLGAAIAAFAKEKRDVKLSILTRSSSEILESVLDDRIELGIGRFPRLPRPLEKIDLKLPHVLMAITPKINTALSSKRISMQALASLPVIVLPKHSATRRTVDKNLSDHGLELNVSIEAGGCFAIKEFTRLGLGIGLVHNICISNDERSEFIVRDLNHIFGQWKTSLIYKKSRQLSPAHKDLIGRIFNAITQWKTKQGGAGRVTKAGVPL